MTDSDASAHHFLQQMREQLEAFRESARVARRQRDEADARLADAEARAAHMEVVVRTLLVYGEGAESSEKDEAGDGSIGHESSEAPSIEEAILQTLHKGVALSPSEIARSVEALGVSQSPGSVRARLSKLVKQGILQRDDKSKYSINKVGSEAFQG
ncbi:Lrp/AsnC family transcriptional regulator [Actinacidiphila oryziradicis]|uniref:Lrp/AsnC family transcriptional regulator n=1 Tax=Actinacidiphila oryziradicis TaxID=2571141 RepID=A0A4U0S1F4_9ACTN|nr:Lrp/AsnC family transcriptional regulator [Actinacidiphila oryziradicis]TKA01943.1 Lrp/AsnC family transcriptional regulator [Actinacidiphila oryziradicis]